MKLDNYFKAGIFLSLSFIFVGIFFMSLAISNIIKVETKNLKLINRLAENDIEINKAIRKLADLHMTKLKGGRE